METKSPESYTLSPATEHQILKALTIPQNLTFPTLLLRTSFVAFVFSSAPKRPPPGAAGRAGPAPRVLRSSLFCLGLKGLCRCEERFLRKLQLGLGLSAF